MVLCVQLLSAAVITTPPWLFHTLPGYLSTSSVPGQSTTVAARSGVLNTSATPKLFSPDPVPTQNTTQLLSIHLKLECLIGLVHWTILGMASAD
jgi:hypothetical protein